VVGKTPYEAWTGKKPIISHLRRVGCLAYAHVPKEERGKLNPKSKALIMLGYGECVKGYRLYDKDRRQVIYSKDVIFNELKNGFGQDGQNAPVPAVIFDELFDQPLGEEDL
jgi:hypothetical protein